MSKEFCPLKVTGEDAARKCDKKKCVWWITYKDNGSGLEETDCSMVLHTKTTLPRFSKEFLYNGGE